MNTPDEIVKSIKDTLASRRDTMDYSTIGLLTELITEFEENVWVKARNLMGVKELAELFMVNRTTITGWAARQSTFPLPVSYPGSGPQWDAIDVINWWNGWHTIKGKKAGHLDPNLLKGLGL